MANDNQTALMMSIKRKKDRVKNLKNERSKLTAGSDRSLRLTTKIRVLKDEITEDEKLLAVEREQHKNTWIMAGGSFSLFDDHYEKYKQ